MFVPDECNNPATVTASIDINDDNGYNIEICEEHVEVALLYFSANGEDFTLVPGLECSGTCDWEPHWDDPEEAVRERADNFLGEEEELVERVLKGDRDALLDLVTRHSETFARRPLW